MAPQKLNREQLTTQRVHAEVHARDNWNQAPSAGGGRSQQSSGGTAQVSAGTGQIKG